MSYLPHQHVMQGSVSSLAPEYGSPGSRSSSSQALDSPMRGNAVCRICDEVVRSTAQMVLQDRCCFLRAALQDVSKHSLKVDAQATPLPCRFLQAQCRTTH